MWGVRLLSFISWISPVLAAVERPKVSSDDRRRLRIAAPSKAPVRRRSTVGAP